jgi:hypothetical protein
MTCIGVIRKAPQRGHNMGLIFLEEKFLLRARLLILHRSLFHKLGEIFGTSSFHLPNFERTFGSKTWHVHGTCYLKPHICLCKASLAHPS